MIELDFLDSSDKDILGKRCYYFDTISIGRNLGNTVIISDPKLSGVDVIAEVFKDGVDICTGDAEFFISGDEKIYDKKRHKEGDKIRIGDTVFKIVSFKKTEVEGDDFESMYQATIEEDPEKEHLFNALKQELAHIEAQKK